MTMTFAMGYNEYEIVEDYDGRAVIRDYHNDHRDISIYDRAVFLEAIRKI